MTQKPTYIYVRWPDGTRDVLGEFAPDEDPDYIEQFWEGHYYIENSLGGTIWTSSRPPELELA